ncbi:MAG: hypothetical protein MUC92_02560 [Fimbriimonadaceae bacterium]|nr:hypothetical protein [Fimbriimonadaceae bacterium]
MKGFTLALLVCLSSLVCAQKVVEPAVGTPLRKAVLDGLRPTVEKELKQKVVFKVDKLRVLGDWAFYSGKVLQPNGKDIDWKKTSYKEQFESGMFDDWICALLKRDRNGKWVRVTHVIGATDVTWADWHERFKCPKAVLPFPENLEGGGSAH